MDLKESIDFKSGDITYYDFNINPTLPLKDQIAYMQDNLIQIEYSNYIVDVGWRPECNINGSFIILVIKNHDWQAPICIKETRSLPLLKQYLQECIDLAANLANNRDSCNLIQHDLATIEYENFNFDKSQFKDFFDQEHIDDIQSGSFHYSITLEHGFEFEINILAIDKFVSVKLQNDSLQSPIFDIGFEEIVEIKLNKRDGLDYVTLDLYKKNQEISNDGNAHQPYLSIVIKPSVSITLGV